MYSLYALCLYGISINQVKKLVETGLTIEDFKQRTDKTITIATHKPSLYQNILEIIPSIKDEEQKDNLYHLAHEGLSGQIIKNLIDLNITYQDLNELSLEKYNEMVGGNRTSVYKKIMSAFEAVETNKDRIPLRIVRELILEILENLHLDESITIEKMEEILKEKTIQTLDKKIIQSMLHQLSEVNYVNLDTDGVKRCYPKLLDYLSKEFKDKEIFIKRLQGQTLFQLANAYQYSRQGIRNIETRVIKRMPIFEEDLRYRTDFERYDFSQELFCRLYEEPVEVYNYLNAKYTKGNLTLLSDIFSSKFTDQQRRFILRYYNQFINKQGEIKEISKMSIFEEVVSRYALDPVTDTEMVVKFNEYIIKNNLPKSYISEESSLRGISDRCQNTVRGKGNTYRYYDFEAISNDIIQSLTEQLDLSPGVYSMKKIFRENPELMMEIDIRTEYELHNLYRRLVDVENVNYTRMPEFTIGNIEKKEFFIGLFQEYSPILLKDFVRYVEEEYGLRQDSLTSYILGYLIEYIHEDYIKTDYIEMTEEEYQQLKSVLTNPIYRVEELKKVGKSIREDFDERFINNMNLSKVNYQIKSNFVLSSTYNSIDEYFRTTILSEDYFTNEHLDVYKTQSFKAVLYNLEKTFEIFTIEKDVYITFKKLKEAGITLDVILDYKRSLLNFIEEDDRYFTLYSVREEGFEHYLDSLGFSDIFYERLIFAFEEFRGTQVSNTYIFRKTNSAVSLRDFLYNYVSTKRVIKLEDLIDQIEQSYNIVLESSKVIFLLRQMDVFYSEELYKFYIDKEDYFEEVYE
jgi:hypothetical protein